MSQPPQSRQARANGAVALLALVFALCLVQPGRSQTQGCIENSKRGAGFWQGYSGHLILDNSNNAPKLDCGQQPNIKCHASYSSGGQFKLESCANFWSYCEPLLTNFGKAGATWAYNVAPVNGKVVTPKLCYYSKQSTCSGGKKDHILVQPIKPCIGVENHATDNCQREDVWDAAWDIIKSASMHNDAVMTINCAGRRGQHQLHVHVSEVVTGLKTWLSGLTADTDWQFAKCTGADKLACTGKQPKPAGFPAQPLPTNMVAAQCTSVNNGRGPSDVSPFRTVYGIPIQQNLVFDKTCATTAVYSPRPYVYCVIVLQDRAAECVQQSEVKKLGSSCP